MDPGLAISGPPDVFEKMMCGGTGGECWTLIDLLLAAALPILADRDFQVSTRARIDIDFYPALRNVELLSQ